MIRSVTSKWLLCLLSGYLCLPSVAQDPLTMNWEKNFLTINGSFGSVKVLYIEAYCRPGSSDRDWRETVIGHSTELISISENRQIMELRCTLRDGVVVDHVITSSEDEIDFRLTATNPTETPSEAVWAQPCIQVAGFTGANQETYLSKCFVFVDGAAKRMPFEPWATKARYTPGQVWGPKSIDRNDLNPRPISEVIPSNGLIGCYSEDEKLILATAWEPYQELFQGVITCIHTDFRIGGLKPGETKMMRGKIYFVPADLPSLLERYEKDFPEQQKKN